MAKDQLLEQPLTETIIGAFYEVYNRLGYGFLEKVYVKALLIELRHRGLDARREVKVDVLYRDFFVCSQRIDLTVVGRVIVEVKAADTMPAIASKQCQSYLKVMNLQVGLVLNFGLKPQIKRVIYNGPPLANEHVQVRFPKEAGPAH
jgi:GxxExxY protein